jgi:hypothetical protein
MRSQIGGGFSFLHMLTHVDISLPHRCRSPLSRVSRVLRHNASAASAATASIHLGQQQRGRGRASAAAAHRTCPGTPRILARFGAARPRTRRTRFDHCVISRTCQVRRSPTPAGYKRRLGARTRASRRRKNFVDDTFAIGARFRPLVSGDLFAHRTCAHLKQGFYL